MKKLFTIIVVALFLLGGSALAQTAHEVDFSWGLSSTTGATYNIYRAPCGTVSSGICTAGEGTYAVIGTTAAGVNSYADKTVAAAGQYVYYVTAVCASGGGCPTGYGGESTPSNKVATVVPANTPAPPGSLTIIKVAQNNIGNKTYVVAQWEAPTTSTNFALNDWKGGQLITGSSQSPTGIYEASWTIKRESKPVSLTVCDSIGSCVTTSSSNTARGIQILRVR